MKKELIISLAGLSMLVILASSPLTTAVSTFVGVEVGDSYNYVFSNLYYWYKENNVVQFEELGEGIVDNQITVTIDAIFDSNDIWYLGLPGETTAFNLTESVGGQDYQAQTALDMWYSYFISIEFLYMMLVMEFDPYDPPSDLIDQPNTTDYNMFKGLPFIANTNTSFYEQLVAEPPTSSTINFVPDNTDIDNPTINPYILPNKTVEVSYENNLFILNITNQDYFEGSLSSTQLEVYTPWNIQGFSKYYVEIDTKKGLVKDIRYELSFKVDYAGSISALHMKVGIKQGSGRTFTLGVSYLEPLLAVLGLTAVWAIAKKKKK